MSVFDGQNQRSGGLPLSPLLSFRPHRFVHIGPGLKQPEHDVGASFAHGKEKWRKTGRERRAKVGPGLEQCIDDFDMPFRRSPHQRGLILVFAGVDVGSVREQRFDRTDPAGARRGHQGRLSAGQASHSGLPRPRAAIRRSPCCRWCKRAREASRRNG